RRAAGRQPGVAALCLAQLTLLALEQEDWELGGDTADRAVAVLDDGPGLGTEPRMALVHAAAAWARAQRGRVDAARQDHVAAIRLPDGAAQLPPWYPAQARVVLARAALRLSDAAAARALLVDASRALRRAPDATVLAAWIEDAWERA